jgi:hypothetical protein
VLQVSSGKFFSSIEPDNLYVTTHRGVLYTNYRFLRDRVTTVVGDILPATAYSDLRTVTCEVLDRMPRPGGIDQQGAIVSVGPDVFINDFSALISFRLRAVCAPDKDLAQRLVCAQRPALGIAGLPRQYVARMFDVEIPYSEQEVVILQAFIADLIGLERRAYEGAIRAIRRFVTAMHRMSDDLDLAYALLVAAIEALSQEFDGFVPAWSDLTDVKRKPLDSALAGAPEDTVSRVRDAVLSTEHVALKRRFCEFSIQYLNARFFREEAANQSRPVGKSELRVALKKAYDLRSKYVHTMDSLPTNLLACPSHSDILTIDSRPHLSFHGLARLAHHIIVEFVNRSPKIERETFDCSTVYPNAIKGQLAPQYWIHNAEWYSPSTSQAVLSGFLSQLADRKMNPERMVSDLRAVATKIETLVPSLAKPEQKLPMLALYVLFLPFRSTNERTIAQQFMAPYWALFDTPCIENLIAHLLFDEQPPPWSLDVSARLLEEYSEQRFRRDSADAGPLIGAALILWIAEMYRASGDDARAFELIKYAVEEYPQHKALREFETELSRQGMCKIAPWAVLNPGTPCLSTSA